jgi:hypothetical protein
LSGVRSVIIGVLARAGTRGSEGLVVVVMVGLLGGLAGGGCFCGGCMAAIARARTRRVERELDLGTCRGRPWAVPTFALALSASEEIRLSEILAPPAGTVKKQRIYKPAGVELHAEFRLAAPLGTGPSRARKGRAMKKSEEKKEQGVRRRNAGTVVPGFRFRSIRATRIGLQARKSPATFPRTDLGPARDRQI